MPSQPGRPSAPAPVRSLRDLSAAVHACTACELHRERTRPVAGEGPDDARLLVVGTAPRRHEDLLGSAFAGARRNVVAHALEAAGIGIDEVRRTSLVRCRPGDDRAPSMAQVAACRTHLRDELRLVAPEVVVALGALPTAVLLGRPVPIERVSGYRFDILHGITLIPSHDPNDAVRGAQQATRALHRDFAVAKAVLDGRLTTGPAMVAARPHRTPAG